MSSKQASDFGAKTSEQESRPVTAMRIELWILACLGVIAFLYFARSVVLPVVLACVAAMALRPLMQWLTQLHIPQVVSAVLVMGFFMSVAGIVLAQLEGPAVQWLNRAPEYRERLEKFSDKFIHAEKKPKPASDAHPNGNATPAQAPPTPRPPMQIDYKTILAWTGSTLTEAVEVLVLLFLVLTSEDWSSQKLEQLLPSRAGKRWAAATITEIQRNISGYLFSISVINSVLGLAVGIGLALMHFPNATMWGVMAALLNYIPYFGPIVGIILVGLVSFFTLDTIPKEVMPMSWYLVVHLLEADLITPVILGRRFTIHPVIILVSLMFWTWLWGISGALLAVPLLMSAKVICERVPALAVLCDLLGHDPHALANKQPLTAKK